MHTIEPYHRWTGQYDAARDARSPFYGKEYNYNQYAETIYNYYIDPAWDYIGSETLYIKILFADYTEQFAIIEMLGEWNDAIHNDIMHLKRNIIDHMTQQGIVHFVLIGEQVFNFHGSDDCYYEEWFDDVEDGWIAAIGFRDFVYEEWKKYGIDYYLVGGAGLEVPDWRIFAPKVLFHKIDAEIRRRIGF